MRRTMLSLMALAAASAVSVAPASAAVIAGLANTGIDADANGLDDNWKLGANDAFVGSGATHPAWLANSASSSWLTPTAIANDGALDPSSNGTYTYTLNFSLAGFDASTAAFAGRFAADNLVSSATLNGTTLLLGGSGAFNSFTNFASNGGFVAGENTLSFTVTNLAQNGGNPSGFRAEFLASNANAVPEPATWAMMLVGFGVVGASMRRQPRLRRAQIA